MHLWIKNSVKVLGFVLLTLLPFWLCRIILVTGSENLGITSWYDYIFTSLRFDLKTASIWYSVFYVVRFFGLFVKSKWYVVLSHVLFLLLFLSSLVFGLIAVFYFPISKNIVGIELFQLIDGQEFIVILEYIIDYWYAILGVLVLLFFVYKVFLRTKLELNVRQNVLFSVGSLLLIVFLARGGIALKPLNLLDAYAALDSKEAISAVTPNYVLLESIGKNELEEVNYFPKEEVIQELEKDKYVLPDLSVRKPNVCLILLESFGKEYTHLNGLGRQSYTPFLDSLMQQSVYFSNAYANGLRSMDAVASTMLGVPSLMKKPFIGSLYTQNSARSIQQELKELGYYTSFYHAADELSMGFKPFLKSKNLDDYFAKQQYPDRRDFDGTWGIFDLPYLKYCSQKLGDQREPWFSGIFTLSSHHPYAVPGEYQYLEKGTTDIHQSVRYTDESLRSFFEVASKEEWFKNTVFIITADHSSINETLEFQTYRGKYSVPLMIYAPSLLATKKVNHIVQHLDIYPTVKQLAGGKSTVSMGRSLFDTSSRDVVHYDGNVYVITNDSLSLQWNGVSNYELFAYKTDLSHQRNIADEKVAEGQEMFKTLKMFIQKFNYRMLNDDFN